MEDITDYLINREDSIEYKNGSDTNVGSIEEDIKILEKFLKEMDDVFQQTKINNTKERKALANLLEDHKKQKQESKQWKQMYLDEVDGHVDAILLYNGLLNKIKNKLKEINKTYNKCVNDIYKNPTNALIEFQRLVGKKEILQELLKESEETNGKI